MKLIISTLLKLVLSIYQVWILISIFGILLSFILKILINKNYSWININFDIIRLFASQDINFCKFIRNVKNKTSIIITMILLLFFSSIMTKCFSSLLLNTYFKLIKVPFVDSLEQLLNGDPTLIASMDFTLGLMKFYKMYDNSQIELLNKRKYDYEIDTKLDMKQGGALFHTRVVEDLIEGKVIVMETGSRVIYFLELFKSDNDKFVVSKKYYQQQRGHRINMQSTNVKQQIFGLVLFCRLL